MLQQRDQLKHSWHVLGLGEAGVAAFVCEHPYLPHPRPPTAEGAQACPRLLSPLSPGSARGLPQTAFSGRVGRPVWTPRRAETQRPFWFSLLRGPGVCDSRIHGTHPKGDVIGFLPCRVMAVGTSTRRGHRGRHGVPAVGTARCGGDSDCSPVPSGPPCPPQTSEVCHRTSAVGDTSDW